MWKSICGKNGRKIENKTYDGGEIYRRVYIRINGMDIKARKNREV